jgi:hypothetical protein
MMPTLTARANARDDVDAERLPLEVVFADGEVGRRSQVAKQLLNNSNFDSSSASRARGPRPLDAHHCSSTARSSRRFARHPPPARRSHRLVVVEPQNIERDARRRRARRRALKQLRRAEPSTFESFARRRAKQFRGWPDAQRQLTE